MSYDREVNVHIDDYGYQLEFNPRDEDGTPIPLNFLSGVSGLCFKVVSGLTFQMWRDCASGHFQIDSYSGGLVTYTVQSGFFDVNGVFEGKLIMRFSGMRLITSDDLKISVTGRP